MITLYDNNTTQHNTTFTSFKDSNLFSKKDWVFDNEIVKVFMYIGPVIMVFILYEIITSIISYKKQTKYNNLILLIIVIIVICCSFIFTDLFTALMHCVHIDKSYSKHLYDIVNDEIIIPVKNGYASCHHIFPSNWKDISDISLFSNGVILAIIPFTLTYLYIENYLIKIFFYFFVSFIILSLYTHKYAHEKLHNRHVPWLFDKLIEWKCTLQPKRHQKHHIDNNYNWAFLNGITDNIFNFMVRTIGYIFKIYPNEEDITNIKNFVKLQDKNGFVNIQFVGDVNGKLKCKLCGNLIVKCE